MSRVTEADKADFRGYLKNCTDRQVLGVLEKEKKAGRRVYARLAREEAIHRGLITP